MCQLAKCTDFSTEICSRTANKRTCATIVRVRACVCACERIFFLTHNVAQQGAGTIHVSRKGRYFVQSIFIKFHRILSNFIEFYHSFIVVCPSLCVRQLCEYVRQILKLCVYVCDRIFLCVNISNQLIGCRLWCSICNNFYRPIVNGPPRMIQYLLKFHWFNLLTKIAKFPIILLQVLNVSWMQVRFNVLNVLHHNANWGKLNHLEYIFSRTFGSKII